MTLVRKNQRNLTKAERHRFVEAVLELKRRGKYDDYVEMHNKYFVSDGEPGKRVAHMTPSFMPWHRKFLIEFESDLREIDDRVALPYWEWDADHDPDGAPWTDDFMGGDGRDSDSQVMTGPFAHRNGNWTITDGVTEEPFLMRRFGRPENPVGLPTRREVAHTLRIAPYDADPWDSTARTGFRNAFEGWTESGEEGGFVMHNRVHLWVGGHMTGGTSPNDPVFWMHHAYIDKLWSQWQRLHPRESQYLPEEPLPPEHPDAGQVASLHEPLDPWITTPADMLDHRRFYRYEN